MLLRSKRLLTQLHIGQNATIRAPDFYHGPSHLRNLSVIVFVEKKYFYDFGCRKGQLMNKETTADLDLVSESLLSPKEVSDFKITLLTVVPKATEEQ